MLGSDGLWDHCSPRNAVDIVSREATAMGASTELIKKSQEGWEVENPEFVDDITAMVVFLPGYKGNRE